MYDLLITLLIRTFNSFIYIVLEFSKIYIVRSNDFVMQVKSLSFLLCI